MNTEDPIRYAAENGLALPARHWYPTGINEAGIQLWASEPWTPIGPPINRERSAHETCRCEFSKRGSRYDE